MHEQFADKGNPLGRFVEECGEAIAAAGKTIRFGLDAVNPLLPPEEQESNADWLLRETLDVMLAAEKLIPELQKHIEERGR